MKFKLKSKNRHFRGQVSNFSFYSFLVKRAANRFRDRKFYRKLWNFPPDDIKIIVSNTHRPQSSESPYFGYELYDRPGPGDAEALSFITPGLLSLYDPAIFLPIEYANKAKYENYKDKNLILIGGPSTNYVTLQALEILEKEKRLKVKFSSPKFDYLESEKGEEFKYKIEKSGIKYDYGTIIKVPSPFNHNRILVILAGIRTYGTYACGAAIGISTSLKRIINEFSDRSFQTVAKAYMIKNSPVVANITFEYPDTLTELKLENILHIGGVLGRSAETIIKGTAITKDKKYVQEVLNDLSISGILRLKRRIRICTILKNPHFLLSGATIIGGFGLIIASLLSQYPLFSIIGLAFIVLSECHLLWYRKKSKIGN